MMKDSYQEHRVKGSDPRYRYRGYPIISDQISREGLDTVCKQLEAVLQQGAPGAIVEFGCYAGTTSLFIRRILDDTGQSDRRTFHVYDSFEGLPEKTREDTSAAGVDFAAGKLYASKKELLQHFKNAGLRAPVIHKGWFNQLSADDVPSQIAFAFLDGDFYDSITSSLRLVWPRLAQGGRVLIDDYQRDTLPGVERAVHDFLQKRTVNRLRAEHNIAIIEP